VEDFKLSYFIIAFQQFQIGCHLAGGKPPFVGLCNVTHFWF